MRRDGHDPDARGKDLAMRQSITPVVTLLAPIAAAVLMSVQEFSSVASVLKDSPP